MPPPIPFPFPLRIGTDICQIARIQRILHTRAGRRFVERVLAPEELSHLVHARPALVEHIKNATFRCVESHATTPVGIRGSGALQGLGRWEALETAKKAAAGKEKTGEKHVEREVEGELAKDEGRKTEHNNANNTTNADRQAALFMAGRWAAKEAAFKAHPHLRLGFHDIVILTNPGAEKEVMAEQLPLWNPNAPMALIRAKRPGGEERWDQMAMVSISHEDHYATAVCMGFDAGPVWNTETVELAPEPKPREKKGLLSWFS